MPLIDDQCLKFLLKKIYIYSNKILSTVSWPDIRVSMIFRLMSERSAPSRKILMDRECVTAIIHGVPCVWSEFKIHGREDPATSHNEEERPARLRVKEARKQQNNAKTKKPRKDEENERTRKKRRLDARALYLFTSVCHARRSFRPATSDTRAGRSSFYFISFFLYRKTKIFRLTIRRRSRQLPVSLHCQPRPGLCSASSNFHASREDPVTGHDDLAG